MKQILICFLLYTLQSYAIPTWVHSIPKEHGNTGLSLKRQTNTQRTQDIRLVLALSQRNVETAEELLLAVSDPDSPKYGQYLTVDEISEVFNPSQDAFASVTAWLKTANLSERNIVTSHNSVVASMYPDQLGQLTGLSCDTGFILGSEGGDGSFNSCTVPTHLAQHIDFIHVIRSTPKNEKRHDKREVRRRTQFSSRATGLDNCTLFSTPGCIRSLYNIPFPTQNVSGNELGIFSSTSAYDQNDMNLFYANMTPYIPPDTHPMLNSIDGGVAPVLSMKGHGGEPLLDLSMAYSLIYPQQIRLFQVDDPLYSTSSDYPSIGFDDFLNAIDGSYCTFAGGNDPAIDPTYPDPRPGGYNGTTQCGTYKPTNVISVSYGTGESAFPVKYEQRMCLEFLKLGLQGISVFFGSGDTGVSNRGSCGDGPDGPGTRFEQHFPASCPWVTAVGGTMTIPGNKIVGQYDEVAAEVTFSESKNFSSGGGFSERFLRPWYQDRAVQNYFSNHNPGYGSARYNASGRAYPDVSANSVNFYIWDNGTFIPNDGTSASTPLWASVITLVNQERLLANKTPVGFINPVLYKHPQVLRDITRGSNANCKSNGFEAVEGWDPVTGLGTPQWEQLRDLFLSLP